MSDVWKDVPMASPDMILQLVVDFKNDSDSKKVNLGVGAYRDEQGKPWVLPSVHQAIDRLHKDPNWDHEYLTLAGYQPFLEPSATLLFGKDSAALNEKRISTNQMISGSGSVHIASEILAKYYQFPTDRKTIYVSDPTWPNHYPMLELAGLHPETYNYYHPDTFSLDFDGFKKSLKDAPNGSVFLMHACAHNPSGVDPTQDQWKELVKVFKEKKHFAFFDSAYQGFASGDPDKDAFAVRLFESERVPMLVCQSFAKNTGLYGERIGALHFVLHDAKFAEQLQSQVNAQMRAELSTCPAFGARVVTLLLTDPEIHQQWLKDIKTMSGRIMEMRRGLYDLLVNKYKTPGSWEHILKQIGMFSFLGLNRDQCDRLTNEGHIYLVKTSRISVAGLNPDNLDYVASWIDKVVRGSKM
ncbi:aspartate transaminase [Malassezia yamatoensis]|uniref:Aspartate aminotransferase n=1 Tax=Malassezia yamatoensis TaxID=253288 RepID=A0AAJ6CGI7_9BASI|nr:aspartate transaminase [Malassezia yamatoensis]